MSVFDEYFVQSGNITYPFLLALTVCFLLTCACAVCRTWGHRARRSGLATASCPLWRRWLSQSIPTTTCESALEHCFQTKGLTSWTSRILLFHTTLHLMHASLHLCCTTARLTVVLDGFLSVCDCRCMWRTACSWQNHCSYEARWGHDYVQEITKKKNISLK